MRKYKACEIYYKLHYATLKKKGNKRIEEKKQQKKKNEIWGKQMKRRVLQALYFS